MSANGEPAFELALARVERLIGALEELPDAGARESARELVQVALELHAHGLSRLLEIISTTQGGHALIERLAEDDRVKGLLLLHGLHPDDLETRVRKAVERLRPHLSVAGAQMESMEIAGAAVHLRLRPSASIGSAQTLKQLIENTILEAAPDVANIRIDGLDSAVAFVPVASLKRDGRGHDRKTAERAP